MIFDKEYHRQYREANKERLTEYRKNYYATNRESIREKRKHWRHSRTYINNYQNERRKTDPLYKLSKAIRCRMSRAIHGKGWHKGSSLELLGCTFEELKFHIEKQFKEGMTWLNHGKNGWHIDHIIGLCNAKTEEELIKLCHYTNLQPLWAIENLCKPKYI